MAETMIKAVLGYATGARFEGGIGGVIVLFICGMLLATPFAALSNALALVIRKPESVIGASNFILMPLMFLSPILMAKSVMPDWIRSVSRFNPVNWSVEAAREALDRRSCFRLLLPR